MDACAKGWVGFTSDARGYFGTDIDRLVRAAEADGVLGAIAIDIPIGLPLAGERQADRVARGLLGKRAPSLFPVPVRPALLAGSHAEASTRNREATGKGVSAQTYALRTKILDVDAWVRRTDHPVIEVHPEVCFAVLAGRPLAHPKWSWAGVEERRRLLTGAGVEIPAELGLAGEVARVDDVLDAAVASWTARRHVSGEAVCFPEAPERFGDGPPAAIWA